MAAFLSKKRRDRKHGEASKERRGEVVAHWHVLVDNFNTSALDFYSALEAALAERKMPNIRIARVDRREAGVLSARREYLQVSLGRLKYDICAAPYGTGYFFSSWMAETRPIRIIEWILRFFGKRASTYYALDSRLMFQESVRRALTATIDSVRAAQGLRALSPDEMRPTIQGIDPEKLANT